MLSRRSNDMVAVTAGRIIQLESSIVCVHMHDKDSSLLGTKRIKHYAVSLAKDLIAQP